MALNFYIDIENAAGVRQGSGPITSAANWRYTPRMDAAGDFAFTMPASDPKAATVQKKLIARAFATLQGIRQEVGAGIIDHIEREPQDNGEVLLSVSGADLLRELTYRSVLGLKLYLGGNPVSHAAAVAAVGGYAPSGWSFTPDPAPPNDSVYGYFNGETVLQAQIKTAQKSQSHFYRGTGRSMIFASTFTPSGVRAIKAQGNLTPTTAAIVRLKQVTDLFDLKTRVYLRGSGNAAVQLTLRATTRVAPPGFVLDTINNYIEYSAGVSAYGIIEEQVDFPDIGPVDNTTADVVAASNMLFDAGLEWLKRHSVELDQPTYEVTLAGCGQLLRPMQTVRIVYRDLAAGLDVNTDLNILQATWAVGHDEIATTDLVVSAADKWPDSDQSVLVGTIAEGRVYQALPQLSANSYVTAYRANVDAANSATFRFRFGKEVTQLQQVLFEFQTLAFESTVKAVGGTTSGSGSLPTGGPSNNNTSAAGNNDSGPGGSGDTGPTATTTATTGLTTATAALNTAVTALNTATAGLNTATAGLNTATAALNTATTPLTTATGGNDTAVATLGTATTTLNTGGTGFNTALTSITTALGGNDTATAGLNTATAGLNTATTALTVVAGGNNTNTATLSTATTGLATGSPTGGDTGGGGQHVHIFNITLGGSVINPVGFGAAGTAGGLVSNLAGALYQPSTSGSGNHTHGISDHSHPIADHTHAIASHAHSITDHTHSLSAHSHTLAAHSHTIAAHSHTIADHTHTSLSHAHTLADHSHTLAAHSHTIGTHSHTLTDHTHTLAAHSHTLAAHSHTIADHSHDIADHSHTLAAHSHTVAAHNHTIAAHSHTIPAHSHTMSNHTHSLNNHTHSLADSLSAVYGIFREVARQTFVYSDLEYSVNGGSWLPASASIDAGSGWRRIDLTATVMDANTFRPLQEANTVQMREAATAGLISTLVTWSQSGFQYIFTTTSAHGLSIGDKIVVAGAALGTGGGNPNGSYSVTQIDSSVIFRVQAPSSGSDNALSGGGTVAYVLTGTIDAQLSVRNIIQAIALV